MDCGSECTGIWNYNLCSAEGGYTPEGRMVENTKANQEPVCNYTRDTRLIVVYAAKLIIGEQELWSWCESEIGGLVLTLIPNAQVVLNGYELSPVADNVK